MGKVCVMDSKKQIEFIKEAWGKFLEKKKNENQDLDIKKLESIEEVKKAFLIRDAVAEVAEVDDIDVTEEQVTSLANILIEKEIISQRKPKLKAERMYRRMPPQSFNHISFQSYIPRDVVEEINKPLWRSISEQYEYFNFVADYEEDDFMSKEDITFLINFSFMKESDKSRIGKIFGDYEGPVIEYNKDNIRFIGLSLGDIVDNWKDS